MRTIALFVAIICAILAAGCGSSEQMVSLKTHQSLVDSLNGEINSLNNQTTALRNQISTLEREKSMQSERITDLETMVSSLKEELTTLAPPVTKTGNLSGRETYLRALQLFNEKKYAEAAGIFQSLLDKGAPPMLDDNCHYWLGECAYGQRQYDEAITHFQKTLTYAISEKKDESQIMTARSYVGLGNKEKAKAEYQKLLDMYPASPYIQRAREQMSRQ
jgi:TolA-binding protein